MFQSADNSQKSAPQFSSTPNNQTPVKTVGAPMEQAMIGRSLTIKGDVSGSESLYIDGRIEGSISIPESRVTVGRNGIVAANITAREVVVMGKVNGNIQCSDRLDIRSEGSLTGDVTTQRISVEDGAVLKGSVQVRSVETKHDKTQNQVHVYTKLSESAKASEPTKANEQPKSAAATTHV